MLSKSLSKREHDTSVGNTAIKAKEEIKTVPMPETFSPFDATRDTRQHQPVLPIPHLSDSQNELLSKFAAIADVLRAGKSIV
jgi:hypothetical protein